MNPWPLLLALYTMRTMPCHVVMKDDVANKQGLKWSCTGILGFTVPLWFPEIEPHGEGSRCKLTDTRCNNLFHNPATLNKLG